MADKGQDARFTTLFDLYGLPGNFPGLAEHASCADTEQRAVRLEAAMLADLAADPRRFIPYLQRHEFEALVLAAIPHRKREARGQPAGGARGEGCGSVRHQLPAFRADIGATPLKHELMCVVGPAVSPLPRRHRRGARA